MNETMPEEFWQSIEQFNAGQFYACHDILEALWIDSIEPDKSFYQGILQIAVGLYHLGNNNQRGAMILLGEGCNRLRRYLPSYGNINVEELFTQSMDLLKTLQEESLDPIANAGLDKNQDRILPSISLGHDY
jgi:predicted metal-dependent hydrolase